MKVAGHLSQGAWQYYSSQNYVIMLLNVMEIINEIMLKYSVME